MNDIREDILQKRYYWKDDNGNPIEDWSGLCKRVVTNIAMNEEEEKDFYEILHSCKFLPNTPTLINAGRHNFNYSACFVIGIEDSIESIYEGVKTTAKIHQSGGGTGFNFSKLRPKGGMVGANKGVASGPCSFLKVYNASTEAIKAGGIRKGANMGILNVSHPDIEEFINLKKEDETVSNFNISIGITDDFLQAVKEDKEWNLIFKEKIYKTVKAKDIWNLLINNAWENGEPGIIFLDTINKFNTLPGLGRLDATNPCSEQNLYPGEICCLGSINIFKFVLKKEWNWEGLKDTIYKAVRFLDNILDVQGYILPEMEDIQKKNRKIGLGIMGWADCLIKKGIKYNSDEALEEASKLMEFINSTAIEASQELAKEKGGFPNMDKSIYTLPMRNAAVTTCAPTGTLSILAQVSSGIEPVYDFKTIQKRPIGDHIVIHPLYKEYIEKNPGKPLPEYFITAKEISPEWHVKMQATFQKHIQSSISKTINLPSSATKEDVEKVFFLSHELGCKSITCYRDGSRKNQVLTSIKDAKDSTDFEVLDAKRVQITTPDGNIYLNISFHKEKPMEVFITTPDEAYKNCPKCNTIVSTGGGENYDALARIVSLGLRHGIPVKKLMEQLEKANRKFGNLNSVPAAIIRAFSKLNINGDTKILCPDCNNILIFEENCAKCSCGYSRCS